MLYIPDEISIPLNKLHPMRAMTIAKLPGCKIGLFRPFPCHLALIPSENRDLRNTHEAPSFLTGASYLTRRGHLAFTMLKQILRNSRPSGDSRKGFLRFSETFDAWNLRKDCLDSS